MNPALVILAGGESRRLGACKALVDLGGRTPLERLLAAGRCMDGAPPLVVTGAHHDAIAAALPPGVEVVRNERWNEGRSGSAARAARARPGLDLCFAPVDVPLVEALVFEGLRAAWERDRGPRAWLQPVHAAPGATPRSGHPVVVGFALCARLASALAEPGFAWKDFPLRSLRDAAEPRVSCAVDSASILDDLDTPADLERLRRRIS